MRDGWRSRRFCNRPTTHEVRWFAGFVTVGDGFEEDRREVWKPMQVRVCAEHAARIRRYQTSIGARVGAYRYR